MSGPADLLGFYALLGPDRPRKLLRVQALERALGVGPLDRHAVDAAGAGPELAALCRQRPAQGMARLIVVDGAHRLTMPAVEALTQHAAAIQQTACVIFLLDEPPSARAAVSKLPGKLLRTEEFPDCDRPALKPFALIDALGRRAPAAALTALEDQLAAGRDPLEVLALISWQLQRWMLIARCTEAGWSEERIGQATGLRGWQLQRLAAEVAGASRPAFERLLGWCWRIEADVKTGRRLAPVALAELVTAVCERAVPETAVTV